MAGRTVKEFLDALASRDPVPGGGSAAALSGAMGAALLAMVCRLTQDRRGYEEVEGDARISQEDAEGLRARLEELVEADADAYGAVVEAMRRQAETAEEEKQARQEAIQKALHRAADVPRETGRLCLEVLALAEKVATFGNYNALSDVIVGALMAAAGARGAFANVRINLQAIEDAEYCTVLQAEVADMEERCGALEVTVLTAANTRARATAKGPG
jgi:formiminotetrahydrofolate cyclodeaminase